jgi:uncharacterized peroxidase-related enzyme
MTWIETVAYEQAEGKLKRLYERVKGPDDNVDNIMLAHSLRPHSMEGHLQLYKNVLHHSGNGVPSWFLEAIGVLTSMLNRCAYCVEHHFTGMVRLLEDATRSQQIRDALARRRWEQQFDRQECAALDYVTLLTQHPADVSEAEIQALRDAGWDDGEILEINQVTAYFAYANRTVLGLGVDVQGDVLGLSPGDTADPDNWRHQ